MVIPAPAENHLLGLLPEAERKRLLRGMERVPTPARTVLCERGEPLRTVLFPLSGVISLVVVLENQSLVEVTAVGNEGMIGVDMLLRLQEPSPYRVIQQVEGESLCIEAKHFHTLLSRSGKLHRVVARFAVVLWQQAAQSAACNLHHSVEARLARWLLTCGDRAGEDKFSITQDFLSVMLGVRRQSVNVTASALQEAGVISYRWGRLRILDRPALEATACECYRACRDVYQRIMSGPV